MASDIRIPDLIGINMLTGMFGAANVQANSGLIRVYAGAQPAGEPLLAGSHGTVLAEFVLANPAFFAPPAAAGAYVVLTLDADPDIVDAAAEGAGTALHFCLIDDAAPDVILMSGSAGEAADSTDMTIDNKLIAVGATVTLTTMAISMPKGWTT